MAKENEFTYLIMNSNVLTKKNIERNKFVLNSIKIRKLFM